MHFPKLLPCNFLPIIFSGTHIPWISDFLNWFPNWVSHYLAHGQVPDPLFSIMYHFPTLGKHSKENMGLSLSQFIPLCNDYSPWSPPKCTLSRGSGPIQALADIFPWLSVRVRRMEARDGLRPFFPKMPLDSLQAKCVDPFYSNLQTPHTSISSLKKRSNTLPQPTLRHPELHIP